MNVANTKNGEKILYDISPIKKVGQSVESDTIPTENNVAQENPTVKHSLSDENTVPGNYGNCRVSGEEIALEGKLVVINRNKAEQMLATIGIQPSEVSRILNLARDSLSQTDKSVNRQYSLSDSKLLMV